MAAVTLKDLMDPLTKIQAATESTAESLDALTLVLATSGQSAGGAVQFQILKELRIQTKLMQKDSGGGLAGLLGGGGGKGSKGMLEGGNAFKMLGAGTIDMAKGLLIFMLVPTKTIKKYNDFVKTQIELWADSDSKKMNAGANAMMAIGDSILNFSKSLALAAILLIPAAIGLPLLYIATALVVPLFLLLGMGEKQITKGAKAMDRMGDGLKSFAIGLALFALTTFFILMQPAILIGMVASLVLIGGAVALLGVFDKQIKKGSVALAMMGIGLAIFGLGYALFAFTIAKTAPTLEAIMLQAGVLIGLGIVTAILGSLFSLIIQGAASLAAMGIGLLVFGLGYIPFAHATKDTTLSDIGVQAALLTSLGLLFAAAGAGALFIIPGAAAFAAIGGALLLLAPGLAAIKKVTFTKKDADALATTLAGVKLAFVGPPKGGGVKGFFKSIAGAISGGAGAVEMVASAAGFAAAGIALTKLSAGLKSYKALDWTNEETLKLSTMLTGISGAFAQAGGEAATPTGLFGKVFGNAFSPNATKKGINSVMGAGKALTSIAVGLTEFQKLVESKVDFDVLGVAITKTVGFVQEAFAAIGSQEDVDKGGFFGGLFGIKQNTVQKGIQSVQGAGKALTDIAVGLTEFQKLVESKVDFDAVGSAISMSVGFVQEAFAAIGSQEDVDKGGFFGGLFGIKQNAVQKGIQSVQGAGAELEKIAQGLSTFAGIENPKEVANKIKGVIGMVGNAFAAVGGMKQEKSGFFGLISWDENLVAKGIDAVDGAGAALTDIAGGLKAFSQDGLAPEKVSKSIGRLLTSIGTAFATLYESNPFISMQLNDFKSFIVTLGDVAEKGLLDKAADGITKIADAINKIDIEKTVAFGDLFKASGELSSSSRSYRALASAVEDIRDILAEQQGPSMVEKGFDKIFGNDKKPAAGNTAPTSNPDSMKQLNSTLSRLDRAITALPVNIITGMDGIEVKTTGT